jgi:hypothetical protein
MADEGGENPLVPESENNAAFSNFANINQGFEGSGIFSDAKSTIIDASNGDWGALAGDLVGDGFDALGIIADPMGSLIGAGIGWLIEHISFLKEPLDLLAGDPEEVTRMAQTWTNISNQLTKSAQDYQNSAKTLSEQHKGAAADSYQQAAGDYSTVIAQAATHAQSAAGAMNTAATIVGTTRGVIRDSVAQFCGDAVWKFIAASSLAPVTFGASEAAFITDEVVEGTSLATKIAGKLSKVAKSLDTLAKDGAKSGKVLKEAGGKLKTFEKDAAKLDSKVGKHNLKVRDKQVQIGKREERLADARKAGNEREATRQENYLDNHLRKGGEKIDEQGKELAKSRSELAEDRVDAWKAGARARTSHLGEDHPLVKANEFKERHPVLVGGTKEAIVQDLSTQPTREGDNEKEYDEKFEEWEREHPDYNGSLVGEGSEYVPPSIRPSTIRVSGNLNEE